MELYRLCPVLEVRKIELHSIDAPVFEVDKKRHETLRKTSSLKEDRRTKYASMLLIRHLNFRQRIT